MHLQGWPECKAGGTAAQLQLKAQRTSGPTDEWNQLTVLTVRLTSSLSHCHYRSLQGANLCLEHFRTTNSVQCRPKRMQNLTAWQPLLQTLNFVWGMAWQHGMAADMATDVAINSVGPSSTGKSRPQLKRSRFDPILVCLTFNGYQHFIKLQMSSLYPRDSMFANAHCEASSKVTASNLKAWIWGTNVLSSWHLPGHSCMTGCKHLLKILGFTLPTIPAQNGWTPKKRCNRSTPNPWAKKCNPDDTREPHDWNERWSNLGSSLLLAGFQFRSS